MYKNFATAAVLFSTLILSACQKTETSQAEAASAVQAAVETAVPTSAPAASIPTAEPAAASAPIQAANEQVFEGTIKGYDFATHKFTAKKGQTIQAQLNSSGVAEVVLYGYDDFVPGEKYTLPEDGEYELRVVLPRNAAREDKSETYKLTFSIQ